MNKNQTIKDIKELKETSGIDSAVKYAMNNIPAFREHIDTWGKHCGAPVSVYSGHVLVMLLNSIDTDNNNV